MMKPPAKISQPTNKQINNSCQKPIRISWIATLNEENIQIDQQISQLSNENNQQYLEQYHQQQNIIESHEKSTQNHSEQLQKPSLISNINQNQGKFGLCHCPGKKLAMGRDGKPHNRDLKFDLNEFAEKQNVKTIICLLNEYELRTIGVDLKQYKSFCQSNNIQFIHYPMIEMSIPECGTMDEFDRFMSMISLELNGKNIVCHCRGGIGRAGLIGCCVMLKIKSVGTAKQAIEKIRKTRDPRCVESKKQEDFVRDYQEYLKKQRNGMQS